MTENKTEEQIQPEEKSKSVSGKELLKGSLRERPIGENTHTGFEIEYIPHKTQGLQSASDMWIDKSRLFNDLSGKKKNTESIERLTRQ